MSDEELSRNATVILYCLDIIRELERKGLIECTKGAVHIEEKGEKQLEKMKSEGFEPTQAEMYKTLEGLRAEFGIEVVSGPGRDFFHYSSN